MDRRDGWHRAAYTSCAVALILVLGMCAYGLTAAAGGTYGRLSQVGEDSFRLRVASNYITNHIRRADTTGGITVRQSPFGACLVLCEDIDGERYETRIYYRDGYLRESFVPAETGYDESTDFEVIELNGFSVSYDGGVVRGTLISGRLQLVSSVSPMCGEEVRNEG